MANHEQQQVQVQASNTELEEQQGGAPAKAKEAQAPIMSMEEQPAAEEGGGNMFGCSICLSDVPRSPVLTCCGHLFCWPCIYRWASAEQSCPICKGFLSRSCDFTPIYSAFNSAPSAHAADMADGFQIPNLPHAHRRSQPRQSDYLYVHQDRMPELIQLLEIAADVQHSTPPSAADHVTVPSEAPAPPASRSAAGQGPPTYGRTAPSSAPEPPTIYINSPSSPAHDQGPPRYRQSRPRTYNVRAQFDLRTYLQRRHRSNIQYTHPMSPPPTYHNQAVRALRRSTYTGQTPRPVNDVSTSLTLPLQHNIIARSWYSAAQNLHDRRRHAHPYLRHSGRREAGR